ncbi:hypothetical protein E2C01_050799 [Portunus trituberculatus]|uniref:Uncharacterized protein n=1 Tax=Portunus trituberculatus TaxID=210409 RepID=A0A5B7GHF8_PORTR|nr:hypothetical protein [Portunus trituberculatus]
MYPSSTETAKIHLTLNALHYTMLLRAWTDVSWRGKKGNGSVKGYYPTPPPGRENRTLNSKAVSWAW